MRRTSRRASDNAPLLREVVSPDGSIAFAFKRTHAGVHVARRQQLEDGSRVVHSSLFVTPEEFERFCDADPLRFEHPHTYLQARRVCFDLLKFDAELTTPPSGRYDG